MFVRRFLLVSALFLSTIGGAQTVVNLPQFCSDKNDLGALIACRLHVSRLVGADKYATGAAVEDKAREAVVIENAAKVAKTQNTKLSETEVKEFFAAQIEASKFVQNGVISEKLARREAPVSYVKVADLRGVLDVLTTDLIRALPGACREVTAYNALRADPGADGAAVVLAVNTLPTWP